MSYIVSDSGLFVNNQGVKLMDKDVPTLRWGDAFSITFALPSGTVANNDKYALAVDTDRFLGNGLCVLSEDAVLDVANSTVAFTAVPTNTQKFLNAVNGKSRYTVGQMQLTRYIGGDITSRQTLLDDRCMLQGLVYCNGATAYILDPNAAYTKEQIDTIFETAVIFQFSTNGTSWHDSQTNDDIYLRFRNPALETSAWSDSIRFIRSDIVSLVNRAESAATTASNAATTASNAAVSAGNAATTATNAAYIAIVQATNAENAANTATTAMTNAENFSIIAENAKNVAVNAKNDTVNTMVQADNLAAQCAFLAASASAAAGVATSKANAAAISLNQVNTVKSQIEVMKADVQEMKQVSVESAQSANNANTVSTQKASESQIWAEGSPEAVVILGGTFSAKGWAEKAQEAAQGGGGGGGGVPIPSPSTLDNNKIITVSGGSYSLTDSPTLKNVSIGYNTFGTSGITMPGGTLTVYGNGANRILLEDGGITISEGYGLDIYSYNSGETAVIGGTVTSVLIKGATFTDGTRSLSDYPVLANGTNGQFVMKDNGTFGFGTPTFVLPANATFTSVTSSTCSLGTVSTTVVTIGSLTSLNTTGFTLIGSTISLFGSGANRTFITDGNIMISDGVGLNVISGYEQSTIKGGTVTTAKVTNGTFSIPFFIPVVSSTASSLYLSSDTSYKWDLSASSSACSLTCNTMQDVEMLWSVDIILSANASVQYGVMFDSDNCDALTASKLNRCIVRWDGSNAILVCYKTEDLT